MPYAPAVIANHILGRAFRAGVPVIPMKLQKILWFTAAQYAKATGEALLTERFETWPYGPVLRSMDEKFRPFAGTPIDRYSADAKGIASTVDESRDRPLVEVVDRVWAGTHHLSPVMLARITCLPGSSWCDAVESGDRYIRNDLLAADVSYRTLLDL